MEENLLEQPNLETEQESFSGLENQEGSNFGKFRDAKTLLEAYNSLQAEFTRKSQKLAQFQKESEENALFKKEDSVDEILKDTPDNDKYKKEITEILANNNELYNLPNKYQVAFNIAKNTERKLAETLNNPSFIDNILNNNPQIKENIISNYLSSLNNISSPPKTISGNASNIHFSLTDKQPKTLKDAGEIFSKMLK